VQIKVTPDSVLYITGEKIQQLDIPEEVKAEFKEKHRKPVYFDGGNDTTVTGILLGLELFEYKVSEPEFKYLILLPNSSIRLVPISKSLSLL
jgi:hypothetical protein